MGLFTEIYSDDFEDAEIKFVPLKQSLFHRLEELVNPERFNLYYKDNESETGPNSSHIGLVNLEQNPYYDRIWIYEDDDHYFWIRVYNMFDNNVYGDRHYKCDGEEGLLEFLKKEKALNPFDNKEEFNKLKNRSK